MSNYVAIIPIVSVMLTATAAMLAEAFRQRRIQHHRRASHEGRHVLVRNRSEHDAGRTEIQFLYPRSNAIERAGFDAADDQQIVVAQGR